jgi:hypothetical protein
MSSRPGTSSQHPLKPRSRSRLEALWYQLLVCSYRTVPTPTSVYLPPCSRHESRPTRMLNVWDALGRRRHCSLCSQAGEATSRVYRADVFQLMHTRFSFHPLHLLGPICSTDSTEVDKNLNCAGITVGSGWQLRAAALLPPNDLDRSSRVPALGERVKEGAGRSKRSVRCREDGRGTCSRARRQARRCHRAPRRCCAGSQQYERRGRPRQ